jgi:hypothetical protein
LPSLWRNPGGCPFIGPDYWKLGPLFRVPQILAHADRQIRGREVSGNTDYVPPGRYRVIFSTDPSGAYGEFSADDDAAAWDYAERFGYGARIVMLARVRLGNPDRLQPLERIRIDCSEDCK